MLACLFIFYLRLNYCKEVTKTWEIETQVDVSDGSCFLEKFK